MLTKVAKYKRDAFNRIKTCIIREASNRRDANMQSIAEMQACNTCSFDISSSRDIRTVETAAGDNIIKESRDVNKQKGH